MLFRETGIALGRKQPWDISIPLQERRHIGSRNHNERASGSWRSFRPPDAALESEDERVYFRRTKRNSHHRSAEDSKDVPRSGAVYRRSDSAGQKRPFPGDQTPGAGGDCRRSAALWDVLCEPPLARGHADQLGDTPKIDQAAEAAEIDVRGWPDGRVFQ